MDLKKGGRRINLAPINIQAQLNATHNPSFPLSSPMVEDFNQSGIGRSALEADDATIFGSPDPSVSACTDISSGHTSGQDEFHLERYSQDTETTNKYNSTMKRPKLKRKNTPGLQLITDFSRVKQHTKNIVFDQVAAKRVKPSRNHARSIISHKGVKFSDSPPNAGKHRSTLTTIRDLAASRHKKDHVQSPSNPVSTYHEDREHSPSRRSVVIGLCVSEHEAEAHHRYDVLQSAVTLLTPITPTIVITPPGANLHQADTVRQDTLAPKPQRRPASSMYSTMTFQHDPTFGTAVVPPMPSIPAQHTVPNRVLQSRNPFRNHSQAQVAIVEDESDMHDRTSQDSRELILPNGSQDPRPKSQGWWNMLSPLLSRAGSHASRKNRDVDDSPPPVPPIPTNIEKQTPTSAVHSNASPETPRRQGLAIVRDGTWSEWEDERDSVIDDQSSLDDQEQVHQPRDLPAYTGEGLAAEYYHACAIEQLAGATYFECINHSCAEHLPQLKSIYDVQEKETITLGSPFPGNTTSVEKVKPVKVEIYEVSDDPTTPIDSDGEDDRHPYDKKQPKVSVKEVWSPTIDSDLEPDELSPNIRKANTAAVVRARALGSPEKSPTPLPLYRKDTLPTEMPNIAAFVPALPANPKQGIPSPGPLSPEGQRSLAPAGDIPMMHQQQPTTHPEHVFITNQTSYPELPARHVNAPITIADLRPMYQIRESIEDRRVHNEKEDSRARKVGGLWRGRGCIPKTGCFGRAGREGRKRRRWWMCIALVLTLIVVICIVLATTLTRRGDGTPVQSQWLNLTGYPPMPTGISTIARPALTESESRCMSPTTMWSCALPKEDQASVAPNDPNQPNFRFQIAFRNGTVPANMTIPITKRVTDPSTNDLFVPNPSPRSQADQVFLGSTTDNITKPFDGEQTPFYITFMATTPVVPSAFNTSQKLKNRDLVNNIPGPSLAVDGTAAPASLLPTTPFPISQPIKLYNRGLHDEHFGFYMYYDKSIFLANIAITNSSEANKTATDPNADQTGGSTTAIANVRCTFAQTRFLVKIFTNPHFGATLLAGPPPQNFTSSSSTNSKQNTTITSSATNFSRPGSFPYPTTIILDRHGGDLDSKLVYCYGMSGGEINTNEKQLAFEDRAFGGTLVNPAPGLIDTGSSTFNSSLGGIDGGTGGCGCTWQNWS